MHPSRLLAGAALGSILIAGSAWAQQPQQAGTAPSAAPARRAAATPWQAQKRRGKPAKFDVIATFPGFRMLEGGASRVVLELSRKTDVSELRAEGRVTYRIKGAGAPISTNRLALLTSFFRTPVARVQLVQRDEELDLVIDLRAPSAFTHRIEESEGGALLMIDFPAPPGGAASAAVDAPRAPTQETKRIQPKGDSSY